MKTIFKLTGNFLTYALIVLAGTLVLSCEGPAGPAGPAGAKGDTGDTGAQGPAGQDGKDAVAVTPEDQAAYDAADGVVGARLFDYAINEIDYDATDAAVIDYPDFFRCKSCHGWDLKGQSGVLINKMPSATYPVAATNDLFAYGRNGNANIRQIFDAVKNIGGRTPGIATYNGNMPDYSGLLTDAQIWDLVKFIKETAHDTQEFYDLQVAGVYPNGTKTFSDLGRGGDAANGATVFAANCAGCHGADGTKINIYCKGEYLGDMFRGDPHEIQHKAIWGMPNDRDHIAAGCTDAGMMPAQSISDQDIRDMMVMGQDATAFPGF